MREIKFRAWLPKPKGDNTMRYQVSVSGKSITDLDAFFQETSSAGMVWLQYTGIKDKNDKEIYEGDVVKYKRTKIHDFKDEEYTEEWIGKIVWSQRSEDENDFNFILKNSDHKTGWYVLTNQSRYPKSFFPSHIEVIGNIYENPELLEKQK